MIGNDIDGNDGIDKVSHIKNEDVVGVGDEAMDPGTHVD